MSFISKCFGKQLNTNYICNKNFISEEITKIVISYLAPKDQISLSLTCKYLCKLTSSIQPDSVSLLKRFFSVQVITSELQRQYRIQKTFEESLIGKLKKSKVPCIFLDVEIKFTIKKTFKGLNKNLYVIFNNKNLFGIFDVNLKDNHWKKIYDCTNDIHNLLLSRTTSKLVIIQRGALSLFDIISSKVIKEIPTTQKIECTDIKNDTLFYFTETYLVKLNLQDYNEIKINYPGQFPIECLHCPVNENVVITSSGERLDIFNDETLELIHTHSLFLNISASQILTYQKTMFIRSTHSIVKLQFNDFTQKDTPSTDLLINDLTNYSQIYLHYHLLFAVSTHLIKIFDIVNNNEISTIETKAYIDDFFAEGMKIYTTEGSKIVQYALKNKNQRNNFFKFLH